MSVYAPHINHCKCMRTTVGHFWAQLSTTEPHFLCFFAFSLVERRNVACASFETNKYTLCFMGGVVRHQASIKCRQQQHRQQRFGSQTTIQFQFDFNHFLWSICQFPFVIEINNSHIIVFWFGIIHNSPFFL